MPEKFDANQILRESVVMVDKIKNLVTDDDGNIVGLKNGLKQMLAQSGQYGEASVKIGNKTIKAILNNWVPARETSGYQGEEVVPHSLPAADIRSKYLSGYKPENAPIEAGYLIAFLAMSILNGRTPTSGALNLETSHKANWLYTILENHPEVTIESVTMPGAIQKKTGHQFPEIVTDGNTIKGIAKFASANSAYMLGGSMTPKTSTQSKSGNNAEVMSM